MKENEMKTKSFNETNKTRAENKNKNPQLKRQTNRNMKTRENTNRKLKKSEKNIVAR